MYFSFENISLWSNFTECHDRNKSGLSRFTPSPLASRLMRENKEFKLGIQSVNIKSDHPYIIPTGVNHDPHDWTGPPYTSERYPNRLSFFEYLNKPYLKKLRKGQAMLLLDQSLEGYQKDWLWQFFHEDCDRHGISPNAIIYVTGNLAAAEQYDQWANKFDIKERLKVYPYANFESDIQMTAKKMRLSNNFEYYLDYKKNNIDNIKLYNCMNKRLRGHRIYFYLYLYRANLLDDGLVSMNKVKDFSSVRLDYFDQKEIMQAKKALPRKIYDEDNTEKNDLFYINRIHQQVYKDSWLSIVPEASYFDWERSIFLSEKTFKPIACMNPFVILGSKGSLVKLRDLGYKTFDGFIDESYDRLDDYERFEAVIKIIEDLKSIPDKLAWYESMRDILEYNYNHLQSSKIQITDVYKKIKEYYDEYFGVSDV